MQIASFNDFTVYPCFVIIHRQDGIITPFLVMTFQIPNIYLANFTHFIVKYSALFTLSAITTDDQKLAIQIDRRHFAYCLNKPVYKLKQ
jgi:hypothetical protein